jgi:hypothetical protein
LSAWRGSSAAPRPTATEPLDPAEPISRFLTQSGQFTTGRVKPAAFLPGPDGTTSTFRTQGLTADEKWALGEALVATPRGRRLYGSGDLSVSSVVVTGLSIDPDDDPPRHAGIIGWPEGKDARLSLAQRLAASAALRLRELPGP